MLRVVIMDIIDDVLIGNKKLGVVFRMDTIET